MQEIVDAVKKALSEENNKKRKFTQSVDIVINLKDVDLSKPENRIDEEIELPDRGKEAKVGVFASGEMAARAKEVADIVIKPEELKELAEDKQKAKEIARNYDFFVAEAPLMPSIGKALGRIFAPRGKMPKPIPPDADIEAIVKKLKKSVRIRSKDKPTFHSYAGIETMPPEKIAENIKTILDRVEAKLERGKANIRSVYVKTTMGKSVRVL